MGGHVIDARAAASQHQAKVPRPLDHRVRQGQPLINNGLSRRLPLFDGLDDLLGQDAMIRPTHRVNQFTDHARTVRGGQLDNMDRVYEFFDFHGGLPIRSN